jgi:hypothetical protein
MPSSGKLRCVALVRTDVSEKCNDTIIRVEGISNVVPSSLILSTLMMGKIRPSETSVLTRATRLHTSEDVIQFDKPYYATRCPL